MAVSPARAHEVSRFVLQALDPEIGGPALESLFEVAALEDLRTILGPDARHDPDIHNLYYPDEETLHAITNRFKVAFEPGQRRTRLHNMAVRGPLPYLFHGGDELPLLLDGTKKFGFIDHTFPPMKHDDEDRFDHYVAEGHLHKEEEVTPFAESVVRQDGSVLQGARRVYYTRRGEEWRVKASKLVWSIEQPWDATRERLWSTLFGYEEWQTNYWIRHNRERSEAWSGIPVYCSVSRNQLTAIESVAFRAFPPVDDFPLYFSLSDGRPTHDEAMKLMVPDTSALIRVNVQGRFVVAAMKEQPGPIYAIQRDRFAEFNRNIIDVPELVTVDPAQSPSRNELAKKVSAPSPDTSTN